MLSTLSSVLLSRSCAGCNEPGLDLCRRCRFALAAAPTVDAGAVRAAMAFEGSARNMVLAMKYRNRRRVAAMLAVHLIRRLHLDGFDVVTWAPTSPGRARRRGFDQAELLARAVAKQLRVPCRRLLYRQHGPTQTGRSRLQRLHGPAFRARSARRGLRVLVIDDVVTTGATLSAAATALRAAGFHDVHTVALAATVDHRAVRPRPCGRSARLQQAAAIAS